MLDRDGYRPNVGIVLAEPAQSRCSGASACTSTRGSFRRAASSTARPRSSAMYRELGGGDRPASREHVRILGRTRQWLRYEVPAQWIRRDWRGTYRGQKQIWYLLRLTGRDCDVKLRGERPSGIRRMALARLLGAARCGDRIQARGLPPGAHRAAPLPRRRPAYARPREHRDCNEWTDSTRRCRSVSSATAPAFAARRNRRRRASIAESPALDAMTDLTRDQPGDDPSAGAGRRRQPVHDRARRAAAARGRRSRDGARRVLTATDILGERGLPGVDRAACLSATISASPI